MRRATIGGALTALVAGAALAAAPTAAQPPPITIHASRRLVTFTHAVTISGRLASHRSGVRVVLEASRFPFRRAPRALLRARTTRGGRYRFTTTPTLATRYRVALAARRRRRSARTVVYVRALSSDLRCNLCGRGKAPRRKVYTLRISYVLRYPRVVAGFAARRVYFYFAVTHSRRQPARLPLREVIHQHVIRRGRSTVRISYRARFPGLPYEFQAQSCRRDREARDGLGLPGRHHCGARRITLRQSRGYLG